MLDVGTKQPILCWSALLRNGKRMFRESDWWKPDDIVIRHMEGFKLGWVGNYEDSGASFNEGNIPKKRAREEN